MKKYLILIAALLASASAHAMVAGTVNSGFDAPKVAKGGVIQSPTVGALKQAQIGREVFEKRIYAMKAQYDFSVLGGNSLTASPAGLVLRDVDNSPAVLPKGAVIRDMLIDVITAPQSGAATTISIGAASSVDLKAATAKGSYTGLVAGIPVGSAATAIKLSANASVKAHIVGAPLTAGKFNVLIHYEMSDPQ